MVSEAELYYESPQHKCLMAVEAPFGGLGAVAHFFIMHLKNPYFTESNPFSKKLITL
jgi:hypothetical protein